VAPRLRHDPQDGGRDLPRWGTSRVEAFSDGVFAIAITLLVLEINVDPSEYDHLARALAHEWPAYLAYVTSFLTVGGVWLSHHALFSRLRYVDAVLLRINLVLLLIVSFLPFPTGVLAEALHANNHAERIAIGFYGVTALVLDMVQRLGVRYALSRPDMLEAPPADEVDVQTPATRQENRATALTAVAYGSAIVVGIVLVPRVAVIAYLVVAVRNALVIGAGGRLSVPWVSKQVRRIPGVR
jgi:TMEM175 potassium channel family protein